MPDIIHNSQENRYELVVEGHLSVVDYHMDGDKLVIIHVEVPEQLRGRGIAARMMEEVVRDATSKGLIIVPVCTYAQSYMQQNHAKSA